MTYKDKLKELEENFAEKSLAYLKGDKSLSKTNGFGDIVELEQYQKAYQEFQNASNEYHNLAFYIIKNKINWESEFTD